MGTCFLEQGLATRIHRSASTPAALGASTIDVRPRPPTRERWGTRSVDAFGGEHERRDAVRAASLPVRESVGAVYPRGSGSAKIDGQTGLGVGDPVDGDESPGMAVGAGASGDCCIEVLQPVGGEGGQRLGGDDAVVE